MTFKFSARSLKNLEGIDPWLVKLAHLALELTTVDFAVIEGVRTFERQKELFRAGASKTMKSKHLTGEAIDVAAYVNGGMRWDWPLYEDIAMAFKGAQDVARVGWKNDESLKSLLYPRKLTWGGDWKSFRDGPHFQVEEALAASHGSAKHEAGSAR